jgi:hypothetical protein
MPLRPDITIDKAIALLNEMVEADQPAMHALVETRVPCDGFLYHPGVQCVKCDEGPYHVGMLGILNGLFGTIPTGDKAGWGIIAAVFDDKGQLVRFRRTDEEQVKPVEAV